jgi:tetratricopeptide (TPR) repeat protein
MTVIVGSGQNKKKRWISILSVAVILVLAGGAGIGLRLWQTRQDKPDTATAPKLPQAVGELQDLRASGYAEQFDQRLTEALADPDLDDESRYQLYLQQGHNLAGKQQWEAAVAAYLKAGELRSSYEVADLLGETYRSAGNKAKAIEYYKKAITLIPEDNPVKDTDKTSLELKIKELEEQT